MSREKGRDEEAKSSLRDRFKGLSVSVGVRMLSRGFRGEKGSRGIPEKGGRKTVEIAGTVVRAVVGPNGRIIIIAFKHRVRMVRLGTANPLLVREEECAKANWQGRGFLPKGWCKSRKKP